MHMQIDPAKKINLYNKEFDVMRNDLDTAIQKAVAQMLGLGITDAAIGLKIDLSIIKNTIKDDNAQSGYRESVKAGIKYKVGTVLQKKAETKGKVVGIADKKELLVDDTGAFFLVSQDEASGQLSMFNCWDELMQDITKLAEPGEN